MNTSPTDYIDNFVSFSFFNVLHKSFYKYFDHSMANNFTALTHASLAVLGSGTYLINKYLNLGLQDYITYDMVKKVSTGYFTYDFFYILKHGKKSLLNLLYLYHHFASIYIINKNPDKYRGPDILFWAELSNIPMYFVYYFIKTKNKKKAEFWKKLQVYTYGIIRFPVLGYLTYDALQNVDDKRPVYYVMPVYFMGLMWTINLYKKL